MKNIYLLLSLTYILQFTTQQNWAVQGNLKHFYPLRDNMDNVIDQSLPASGYTIKSSPNRFGQTDSAFRFDNTGSPDYIIFPTEVLKSTTTITFWIYISERSSTQNTLISMSNSSGSEYFFVSDTQVAIDTDQNTFSSRIEMNTWKFITVIESSNFGSPRVRFLMLEV